MASLHSNQVAHQTGSHLWFQKHKAIMSFSTPRWIEIIVHCSVTPSIKFVGTHSKPWVKRGEKSDLPKNTTQCPRPGIEPTPLDPEASTGIMSLPTYPQWAFNHEI